MDDVRLVQTVLHLTGLDFLHGLGDIGSDGAGLGGGHQALGAENLTKAADNAHHVGGSDHDVEAKPVLLLDLLNQIHIADEVSAGLTGGVGLVALGEDQHAGGLTGAVGQDDGAADLLVSVAGVDAELDVDLDGLVELGGGGLHDERKGVGDFILHGAVDLLRAVLIFLTSKQCYILLKVVMRNNPPT